MTLWFYPIDWAATGTWMQAWAGFAGAGAVFYAAHRGAASFEQWLRQRQTERRIAAAERIMTFAYKAKRAIESIRNPGSLGYESDAAEARLKESMKDFENVPQWKRERLIVGQITYDRINAAKDVWAELFECLPIAKAFFGHDCEQQVHAFWTVRARISSGARMYGTADPNREDKHMERYEELMWEGLDEEKPGSIGAQVTAAINYLETHVLPVIAGEQPVAENRTAAK